MLARLRKALADGAPMWAPWLAMRLGLAMTGAGLVLLADKTMQSLRLQFQARTEQIETVLIERMRAYQQVLHGAAALVDASDNVTRAEWNSYVARLDLSGEYSGIQGIGVAELVPAAQLASHEARVRAEGFPDYRLWPQGERELYSAIVYLEPFDWRNQRAFGFDMLSERTRRRAMLRARDTAQPALTGRVTLVQETEEDVQSGVLLYLPLYRGPGVPESVSARRERLIGWVYGVFRMDDLMRGVLGPRLPQLTLRIYDGTGTQAPDLMYSSLPRPPATPFESVRQIELAGQVWTLRFSALPSFARSYANVDSLLTLVFGVTISLLLFMLVRGLVNTRARALALAGDMTSALRQSETQLRTTFDHAALGIMLCSPEDHILESNPALQRMLGYPGDALYGRVAADLVHPHDRLDSGELLRRLQASARNGLTLDERYCAADGTEIIGRTTISMIHDDHNRPRYILRMVEDVTELRRTEQALREAYAELERRVEQRTRELSQRSQELARSNAELEQFAYVASHDLQEPLRTVSSFSRLLERRLDDHLDAESRRYLEFVMAGSRRMHQLVSDLLAFARVGATDVEPAEVDMNALCDRVCNQLESTVQAVGAEIHHDPLPVVRGHPHELEQLLQNLLSNSLKFRREDVPPRIHLSAHAEGNAWCFAFSDNGIGMPAGADPQAFTLFRRLHDRERYPGTGIGLAICKKVVERHGGRIWAESGPGAGTTVYFTLPDRA